MTNGSVLKRPLILSLPLVKIDKMFGFFFPRVKEVCQTRNSIWLITCSSNTPAFFFLSKESYISSILDTTIYHTLKIGIVFKNTNQSVQIIKLGQFFIV